MIALSDRVVLLCCSHGKCFFLNPKHLHQFPNTVITVGAFGLQFSKKTPSGKEKVVLLKAMVISILCISAQLALAIEQAGQQGLVELPVYLTLSHSSMDPCLWDGPAQASSLHWPQACLLTCALGKARKRHKVWVKGKIKA